MSLKDKYQAALTLGEKLQVKGGDVREEGGFLIIKGTTTYQLDKNLIWDEIKKHDGWKTEVKADIRVENTDVYGNVSKYMPIFEANKDILEDPNVIHPGQKLKIPKLD
jgi:hypothetical protein